MDATRSLRETPTDQLRRLYRFMASREYVASRDELKAAGFEITRIESWIRHGRLIKIVRSVYSYGRDVETPEAVRRAALLVAGPGSALVGRSACEALRLVDPGRGLPGLIEVGSPTGQARCLAGRSPALSKTTFKVVRRDFERTDLRTRDGIMLARAALALNDFASSATEREIRFAFLEACRLGLFGGSDVEYCLTRLFHRRGSKRLRPYLALWVPELKRIRSVLEGWFLLVWIERGYPMPKVNERVFGREIDMFWPERSRGLELDGDAFHRDPVQRRLDLEKQHYLEANGLTLDRVTFREFEANPGGVVDRTAAKLGFL